MPEASEAAAASATAPSSGPASRSASGSTSAALRREPRAERLEQLGHGLEAVLVEVVRRALPGAEDEVALEEGVLADRREQRGVVHLAAGGLEDAAGEREHGRRVGRAVGERDHRAVLEVDVDALPPLGEAAAERRSSRRASRATSSGAGQRPYAAASRSPPSSRASGAASASPRRRTRAGSSSGRRRRGRRSAPGRWSQRSSARRRGRGRRCPRRSRPPPGPAPGRRRGRPPRAAPATAREVLAASALERGGERRAVRVEHDGGLDLRRDLGQVR